MPGKVIEAHADIEETCESCHEDAESETQEELCLGCHDEVRTDILAGAGLHGRHPDVKGGGCYTCHDEHEGRDADITGLDITRSRTFTRTSLCSARTAQSTCAGCHAAGTQFRDTPRAVQRLSRRGRRCTRARWRRRARAVTTAAAWRTTSFVHSRVFALTGKHAATPCAGCHENDSFAATPKQCGACHTRRRRSRAAATAPSAAAVTAPSPGPRRRSITPALTGFALRGAHQRLTCESCHVTESRRRIAVDLRGLSSQRRCAPRRAGREVRRLPQRRSVGRDGLRSLDASAASRSPARMRASHARAATRRVSSGARTRVHVVPSRGSA